MTLSEHSEDLFFDIGIDSMGFYSPHLYLDLHFLALKRNVDPDKYRLGLMSSEIRIPDWGEDPVSMATKAAYHALLRGGIDPKSIDAIFVGTETTTYAVKSISNIIKDILDISHNCITQDLANACAAGTLGVLNAVGLIESGIIKRALVVMVDIASYPLGSSGEPTQGAGAIALVISRNPRIALIGKRFGKASGDVNDFFRPMGELNAHVFPHYSVKSYLQFQLMAYDDLIGKVGEFYTDYYVFHAPYGKLPLKFMRKLISDRWWDKLDYLIHMKPRKLSSIFNGELFDRDNGNYILGKELEQKISSLSCDADKKSLIRLWIESEIRSVCLPALKVPRMFGNMYNASLWAEIMYIIEEYAKPDETIYFGSYGSGAVAISGILMVLPTASAVLDNSLKMENFFYEKTHISVEEYEKLRFAWMKGLKSHLKKISWVKLSPYPPANTKAMGISLSFCDGGCLIPKESGINFCPKGHTGHHTIFFPVLGIVSEIIASGDDIVDLMRSGYVPVESEVKPGDIVELHIKRVDSSLLDFEPRSESEKGLIHWLPVYKSYLGRLYEDIPGENQAIYMGSYSAFKEDADLT